MVTRWVRRATGMLCLAALGALAGCAGEDAETAPTFDVAVCVAATEGRSEDEQVQVDLPQPHLPVGAGLPADADRLSPPVGADAGPSSG